MVLVHSVRKTLKHGEDIYSLFINNSLLHKLHLMVRGNNHAHW